MQFPQIEINFVSLWPVLRNMLALLGVPNLPSHIFPNVSWKPPEKFTTTSRKWQDYVYIQCEYKSTKQKLLDNVFFRQDSKLWLNSPSLLSLRLRLLRTWKPPMAGGMDGSLLPDKSRVRRVLARPSTGPGNCKGMKWVKWDRYMGVMVNALTEPEYQ